MHNRMELLKLGKPRCFSMKTGKEVINKPEVNKSHNNQQNKPSEVSGNSSHD